MSSALRLGVLVSGSGTTLQALIDACADGGTPARIVLVASDVPGALALERARRAGIPACALQRRAYGSRAAFEEALRAALDAARVELVCLAGFLRILSPAFTDAFAGRIMNIHPSLLPAFGGRGMYGDRVHEAVLRSGARVTGCTVHFVTAVPDGGPIIAQAEVPVEAGDTVAALSARVRSEERRLYPHAVRLFAEGRLRVEGTRVRILPPAPRGDATSEGGGAAGFRGQERPEEPRAAASEDRR